MSSLSTDGKAAARPITFKAVCRSMVVGLSSPCSQGPLSTNPSLLPQQKPSTLLNLAMVTKEKKPKSKSNETILIIYVDTCVSVFEKESYR